MGSALLSSKVTVTEETTGVSVHTGAPVGMWSMWGIFAFSSTADWNQVLMHTGKYSSTELYPQPTEKFYGKFLG